MNIPEHLRQLKEPLFAEQSSIKDAFKYAMSMTSDKPMMATAIMVYHNTLIESLTKDLEPLSKALKSMLVDIEAMQNGGNTFGPFDYDYEGNIEWPNLAYHLEKLNEIHN